VTRLLLGLCVIALGAGCARQPGRYLFVVPEQLPSGAPSDPQRAELEGWLVERAGGFTEIEGVRGGWRAPDGSVVTEGNRLYLVTVGEHPRRFRSEVRARVIEDFDQQEAYIERW